MTTKIKQKPTSFDLFFPNDLIRFQRTKYFPAEILVLLPTSLTTGNIWRETPRLTAAAAVIGKYNEKHLTVNIGHCRITLVTAEYLPRITILKSHISTKSCRDQVSGIPPF